jgi:hypothetical protein
VADIDLTDTARMSEGALQTLLDLEYHSVAQIEQLLAETVGASPQVALGSGVYVVVDKDNLVYVNAGAIVAVIGLKDKAIPEAGLEVKRRLDARRPCAHEGAAINNLIFI